MNLSIAWTWSLSNLRTFCKLWRLSTRSSWTRHSLTPRAKVRKYLAIVTLPYLNAFTASQETPLPDVVPNTLSGEPSIPPPLHRPRPPRATSPSPTTSERPLTSLSKPLGPEPEIPEVPILRRVRVSTSPAFSSPKCSLISSSRRDGRESETAPRHRRVLAMMGQS
jgi:hypothetical protein